jgi:2-succinyl-5-enolpyruvyl-6-hydroxy-3-cyclohexene-1-carboxylate synthase
LFSGDLRDYEFQSLEDARGFLELDRVASANLQQLFIEEPCSEPGMIAALSRILPARARIFLGNSLPIREWDLAASLAFYPSDIWASRGLNGIDGQISTFLGFCSPEFENWGIFGDLTTLYDLPGPWILNQLPQIKTSLVVVNNEGGKIFSRMFPQKEFLNQHQIRFQGWAELWGLSYEKWREVPQAPQVTQTNRVIELLPDELATQRFWKKFQSC